MGGCPPTAAAASAFLSAVDKTIPNSKVRFTFVIFVLYSVFHTGFPAPTYRQDDNSSNNSLVDIGTALRREENVLTTR